MKLAVITMIRNEADILPCFLPHLAACFDHAYVLDHRSTDGSSEIIASFRKQHPNLDSYRLDFSGYHQKEVSELFLERAFRDGADLLFFLDADEFLDVKSVEELRAKAEALLAKGGIGFMRWKNSVPVDLSDSAGRDPWRLPLPMYVGPESTGYSKVIITRSFYEENRGRFGIAQGNHKVELSDASGKATEAPMHYFGSLFHLPIRSASQLETKVAVGALSYLAKADCRPMEGFHWFNMLARVADGTVTPDVLRGIVASYAAFNHQQKPVTEAALEEMGFVKATFAPVVVPEIPKIPPARDKFQVVAKAIVDFDFDAVKTGSFIVKGKRVTLQSTTGRESLDAIRFRGSDHVFALEEQLAQTRQLLDSVLNSRAWKLGSGLRDTYRLAGTTLRRLTGLVRREGA